MEATAVVTGKILPRSRLRWIGKTYGRMWAVKIVVVRAVYRAFRRCEARFTEGAYSLTALAYSARILWRAWDLISYKNRSRGFLLCRLLIAFRIDLAVVRSPRHRRVRREYVACVQADAGAVTLWSMTPQESEISLPNVQILAPRLWR
jgi:hypothetical protein